MPDSSIAEQKTHALQNTGTLPVFGTNLGCKIDMIRKIGNKYRLVSRKTGRNLGTYPTKAGAEKRERQVQYFKHLGKSIPNLKSYLLKHILEV